MENIYFYPTIDEEMLTDAGCSAGEYEFSYPLEGVNHRLQAKGKSTIRLEDDLETWKIENDGLRVLRKIAIEYPAAFKGPEGIACADAELGTCIIWSNRTLTQMGYIMPESMICLGAKEIYSFNHLFPAGDIKGDLTLDTVVYIKKAADHVRDNERHLMNETGVSVGTIDTVSLSFDSIYMDFPIKDVNDSKLPLWWLEMKDWEDPRIDPFDEDHICLYLNSAYSYCPKVGDTIKNVELLVEIITTAYLMILNKINEKGCLRATLDDSDLEPGSISKIMFYFCDSCVPKIQNEPIEAMQKKIHQNIEFILKGGDEQ